jgi:SurA-like N-terminal domain
MAEKKTVKKATVTKAKVKKSPKVVKNQEMIELPAEMPVVPSSTESQSAEKKQPFLKKTTIIILLILLLAGFGFYFLRKWLVVAEVNGQPISRLDFNHELEAQSGEQVLNALIAKSLLFQEAGNKHITVSQSEVDNKMKEFQKTLSQQGETLDQYLQTKKMSKDSFLEQIKLQIIIEKLLGKDISVSDKEVNDYIDQNKDMLPQSVKPEEIKAEVKQELISQKIQMKIPTLIQGLQKKAKITREVSF